MNIGFIDDDIAYVDADFEHDPPVLRDTSILSQHALNCHRAGHRLHHAWKLVAGRLHEAPVMGSDSGIGEFSADGL
jgi:hypothetical protein